MPRSILDKLKELKAAHDECFHRNKSPTPKKRNSGAITTAANNRAAIKLYCDALKRIEKQRIAEAYVSFVYSV